LENGFENSSKSQFLILESIQTVKKRRENKKGRKKEIKKKWKKI